MLTKIKDISVLRMKRTVESRRRQPEGSQLLDYHLRSDSLDSY